MRTKRQGNRKCGADLLSTSDFILPTNELRLHVHDPIVDFPRQLLVHGRRLRLIRGNQYLVDAVFDIPFYERSQIVRQMTSNLIGDVGFEEQLLDLGGQNLGRDE